jgi:glycosyltransferase involved in cell wall biosynthesis
MTGTIGAVVIGRNEGERLKRCLLSIIPHVERTVYVDSGSSDGSTDLARSLGVEVVELDTSTPFTAARARNAGWRRLLELLPEAEFVQFVDGDCEVVDGWVQKASAFLQTEIDVAATCGRNRERYPEQSLFNRLCDMEWDTPVGDALSCGGNALMRVSHLIAVDGYRDELIAGEEPDLCFRFRRQGWRVVRLDEEMTLHDAAMTRVGQWWQRAKRSGWADMEASLLRGREEPQLRRRVLSNFLWALPLAWPFWPILWLRVQQRRGALYALHIVFGKVPNALGQIKFWKHRLLRRRAELIEYREVSG